MHELISRHDRETEGLVVMSLLVDPEAFDGPYGVWPQEAFYVERYRQIYAAAWALWREDGVCDWHLIAARLRDRKQNQAAGELFGLAAWAWESPTFSAWMLPAYARRMRKLYVEREKGKAALQYQQAIADGQDEHEARVMLDSVLDALDSMDPEAVTTEDIVDLLGSAARFETGYPDVDRYGGGLTKPGLNIIAARPSVGKSALARGIIRRAARAGKPVFWYSGDQGMAQIYELEIAQLRRLNTREVGRMLRSELIAAVDEVRESAWRDLVTLVDRPVDLPRLLSMARASRAELVVVDYLQAVESGVRGESEYESVTRVSKALKGLALEMRVPVLALSQLSRAVEGNEAPTLNSLRASGQIEQDADQVWGLQRDTSLSSDEKQSATLHILKNKTGPTGKVGLFWHGPFASYESAGRL